MYKNIVLALLIQTCYAAGFAQTVRQPLGIPKLEVSRLTTIGKIAAKSLSIANNQTISPLSSCSCMEGCSVVPVKLLSFEGRRENQYLVNLNWKTTNEINNRGFEVERSLGHTRQFETVGFVPADVNAAAVHKYALPDNNDFSGISYYRLKQLDLDNNFAYSDVVPVKGYSNTAGLVLFPNPVMYKLTAAVFSDKLTHATLLVNDAVQKQLFTQQIVLRKGKNLLPLPASGMNAGLYVVRVILEDGQVLSEKFIKR